MPRVRPLLPSVSSDPLATPQPVRRDVSSGTEQLAQGLDRVAAVSNQIAQETRREQDRARLQDTFNDLASTRQDIVSTARKQLGKDALESDLVNQTEQLLNQRADQLQETIPEHLKADFAQIRRQHAVGLRDSVLDHVDQQAQLFTKQQYVGTIATASDLGVSGAVNARPGAVLQTPELGEARQTILNAVAAQTRTMPPQAAAAEKTARLTELHAGVVEALAREQRAGEAVSYLTAARGEMDPARVSVLEKELRPAVLVDRARGEVIRIEQQFPGDTARQADAVLALPDAELGEKARQLFSERMALRERAQVEAKRQVLGTVMDGIEAGKIRSVSALEANAAFGKLPDDARAQARAHLRMLSRERQAEPPTDAQTDNFGRFLWDVARDPTTAQAMSVQEYRDRYGAGVLSPHDYRQGLAIVASVLKAPDKAASSKAVMDAVLEAGRSSGDFPRTAKNGKKLDDPSTWGTGDNAAQQRAAWNWASRQALQWAEQNTDPKTGKVDPVKLRDFAEGLFLKGTEPGRIYGSNPTTSARAIVTGKPFTADVPKEERAKIEAALKDAGRAVSEVNVARAWQARQRQLEAQRASGMGAQ
jgi:hypothetical protein